MRPKLLTFVCDKKKLLSEVNELCKLVERVSEIDYKSKTQSMISVCDRGTGSEQLKSPHGVTVDHNTGNIYVADCYNNCVKVFDNTAKYLTILLSICLNLEMETEKGRCLSQLA